MDVSKDKLENNIPIIAVIAKPPSRPSIILKALVKSINVIVVKGIYKKPGSIGHNDPNKKLKNSNFYWKNIWLKKLRRIEQTTCTQLLNLQYLPKLLELVLLRKLLI